MRSAFTLLELAVTIAVIAVLVGLLIPAIQIARNAALLTQSQTNLRQICSALNLAADAKNGNLPVLFWPSPPAKGGTWVELLPYLDRQDLYSGYFSSDAYQQWSMSANVGVFVNPLDPSYGPLTTR